MCYQRISGNIFNEQFFILKFYCQKKKKEKEKEEKEKEKIVFALLRFLPFCLHH